MLRSPKRGLTLVELLVVIGIIVFLVVLLLPALQGSGSEGHRAACTNNLKQLGLGLLNFEYARGYFPGSCTKPWPTASDTSTYPDAWEAPGIGSVNAAEDNNSGYSWMTMILPYIEEKNLYKRLDLNQDPWNTDNAAVLANPNSAANVTTPCHALVWSTAIDGFLCPSRELDSDRVDPSPYPDSINHAGGIGIDTTPAATSYVALSASHFASLAKTEDNEWAGGRQHPNGTLYPGSKTTFKNMKDGSSNTAIVCETKEPTYSAWYEGTTAGVVGLKTVTGFEKVETEGGHKYGVPVGGVVTLNYGNPAKNQYYCDGESPFNNISKWTYGPSSNHPGVILHLFGDGSIHSLTPSTAPEVYMHLITRAGGEPIPLED